MAVVLCDVASEPASGSLRQNAPIISPLANGTKYFCFCASVPYFSNPKQTSELFTDTTTEADASTFDSSSIKIQYDMASMPLPPYSGDTIIPKNPISPSFFICSAGNFW